MSIGKRTLIPNPAPANRVDPFALLCLRLDHADAILTEAEAELASTLRDAIERRALDDASVAAGSIERASFEIARDLRDARSLASESADDEARRQVAELDARFTAFTATTAPLLARRPPPPALPTSAWLISHATVQTATYVADQDDRARVWGERLGRADAGIAELDTWKRGRDR